MASKTEVLAPNLGLYLDRPVTSVPLRGLSDGMNFRIREGKLNNLNLGWLPFGTPQLNGPVLLFDEFFPTSMGLPEQLLFGTPTDIYLYNPEDQSVSFLTPRYSTGTAAASGTTITGTGTDWVTAQIKTGDEITFGTAGVKDPTAVWHTIASRTNLTTLVLSATAGTVVNGPYTIRRKFTGDKNTIWSSTQFMHSAPNKDQWWATNGIDNIVMWDPSTDQLQDEVGGLTLPFKAKITAVYDNMLTFYNLFQDGAALPAAMANSAPGDPTNFTTGLASQFTVHSGSDEILAAEVLGDTMVIYSKLHIVLAQFTGADTVISFHVSSVGTGVIAQRMVANYGDYHEFIGRSSLYKFDGVNKKEDNTHIWREVLRTQDASRVSLAYNHFDEEQAELMWVLPLTTDPIIAPLTPPATAYVEHYLEPVATNVPTPYSKRSFPFISTGYYRSNTSVTWDQLTKAWTELNFRWNDQFFSPAFPLNLAGDVNGNIFVFNTTQNASGTALPSFVRFGRRALMDALGRGLVARVYPYAEPFSNPLNVSVYMTDHPAGQPTANTTLSFDQTLPEGLFFVTPYRRGRYMEVEFSTDGPNEPFILDGYDVKIKGGGMR